MYTKNGENMNKEERKVEILNRIQNSRDPISATSLAKELGVSRQIIVGDIALLRAEGHDILSTFRGYTLERALERYEMKIVCNHLFDMTQKELEIIVDEGGVVEDVIILHPIYGELRGILDIKSRRDIRNFIEKCEDHPKYLLSALTDGIHLHTISADSMEILERIKVLLEKENILYNSEKEI